MHEWLRRIAILAVLPFKADAPRTIGVYVLMGGGPAVLSLHALWAKLVTDGFIERDGRQIATAAIALGVTSAISISSAWAGLSLLFTLLEKTWQAMDLELMRLTSAVPTMEAHERPEYLDRIELLRVQRQSLGASFQAFMSLISTVGQFAVTIVLLARISNLLLLLPLFALPSLLTNTYASRIVEGALEKSSSGLRRARHLMDVATSPTAGKEVRIFGLTGVLADTHDEERRIVERRRDRAGIQATAVTTIGWVFFSVGYAAALFVVLDRAVRGQATPGDVVMTLSLVATLNGTILSVVGMFGWLLGLLNVVGRLTWLRDFAASTAATVTGTAAAPAVVRDGIRFEGVDFRYPDTEVEVLAGVDLHLPAGSVVAVVGDNGAGKSTLVKLLTRMYTPTTGRITVDGIDLGEIDQAAWRARVAAGFQDFTRFELLAQETVGVGDLGRLADRPVVDGALERAGARDVVATMDRGLDTQLGATFDDGVELSGGQWQKLALGRAMMRADPVLLVLDEPTASLDAPTEHALFERYAGAATRVGRATGAITVLVSHRFSTVRMADLIVVIDGGVVAELGSHGQLMASRGLYAELYGLQARGYR